MVSSTARLVAVLAVLGLALAGCGGSDSDDDGGDGGGATGGGAGDLGACSTAGGCIWYKNYPAGSSAAESQFADGCSQGGGTWGDACPTADMVGNSRAQTVEDATVEYWYYAPTAVATVEATAPRPETPSAPPRVRRPGGVLEYFLQLGEPQQPRDGPETVPDDLHVPGPGAEQRLEPAEDRESSSLMPSACGTTGAGPGRWNTAASASPGWRTPARIGPPAARRSTSTPRSRPSSSPRARS